MKKNLFFLTAVVLLAAALSGCDSGFPNRCLAGKPIVLINATLIDGTGAAPLKDAYCILQEDRVMETGPMDKLVVPAGSCILDLRGKTMLPGIVNSSVAIGFDQERLAAWAQAGVTTVRDMGTPPGRTFTWNELGKMLYEPDGLEKAKKYLNLGLVEALRSNDKNARLLFVGPILAAHGEGVWGPYEARQFLTIYSPEDARIKVEAMLDLGVDVIYVSDVDFGVRLTDAEFKAIVRTAHARGKKVSAKARYPVQIERCLEMGVDDFNFIMNSELQAPLIAQMAAAKSYVVPCLSALETDLVLGDALENTRRYLAAGGKVALGNALGNPYLPVGMPIREFELMEEAGMTPLEVITASTKNAADVCNLGGELGTLEAGKIADIIIITGDPLADIHNLKNVVYVFKSGKMIKKPAQL